jgi:hypothetical protein
MKAALAAMLIAGALSGACGGGSPQISAGTGGHGATGTAAAGASGGGGAGAAGGQAGAGGGTTDAADAMPGDGGGSDLPGSDTGDGGLSDLAPGPPGTWSPIPRSGGAWPPADEYAALVYDSARDVLVLLAAPQDPNLPLDLWEFALATSTWKNGYPSPAPSYSAWPRSRTGFGVAYDSRRGRTFLFGGVYAANFDDLWEWDGTSGTWMALTPNPRPPSWPLNRYGAGLAYDNDRGRLVLFGGVGLDPQVLGYLLHDDLWEWDAGAGAWTDRTPDPRPAAWPAARQYFGMAYDPDRKRFVVFGGDAGTVPQITGMRLADLWEWDGGAATWQQRAATPTAVWPTARMPAATAYLAGRGGLFVYGGYNILADLWEWSTTTSTWTNRTPSPATAWPTGRGSAGVAFVPARNRVFLFGGPRLDDFWSWQPPDP